MRLKNFLVPAVKSTEVNFFKARFSFALGR